MAKETAEGVCHVCGQHKPLTKEHVPPQASPNDRPYIAVTTKQALRTGPREVPEGIKRQGGVSFRTLCKDCNSNYCNRYNRELIRCYQGTAPNLAGQPEGLGILTAHNVYPLRIIKGVVAMFLSINSENFRRSQVGQELADLVMSKNLTGLPDGVKIYMYLNHTGELRYIPFQTKLNFFRGKKWEVSEITYPPLGFVMTLNSDSPDERLRDINHFSQYEYSELDTLDLPLTVLPTYLALLPCDYRTLQEIREDERRNVEEAMRQGIDPASI